MYIRDKLDQQWAQAKSATSPYPKGRVVVRLILLPSGEAETITIMKSSGLTQLDEEALSVVKGSVPFEPFPNDVGQESLTLELNFVYEGVQIK
jgi:TonB family protein